MTAEPFWKTKKLDEMTPQEWESLCDGCAKCCLVKLEDEDTGELYFTSLHCTLLDGKTCQCKDYPNRKKYVPVCVKLTPEIVATGRLAAPVVRLPPGARRQGPARLAPPHQRRSRGCSSRRLFGDATARAPKTGSMTRTHSTMSSTGSTARPPKRKHRLKVGRK